MRPLAKYIGLAATFPALLFVAGSTRAGFKPSSLTPVPHDRQISSQTDAKVANWASKLKSSSEEERRDAAMKLARLPGEAAFRALASAVNDPSAQVRAAVAASLAEHGDESAVGIIVSRLTKDKDQFVRKTAAYALGKFHGGERTASLVGLLKDKDPEVRAAAAISLGDHSDPEAVAPLARALSDKSNFVRAQAAHALGVNGRAAVQAVTMLIELLSKNEDAEVKRQAACALGRIGDRSVLPALQRFRHSGDPYLTRTVTEAIRLIENGGQD